MPEKAKNFHQKLQQAREKAQQTPEVMAALLGLATEEYLALETWDYPNQENLKRMCLMMEWNYYDTQRLIINDMVSPQKRQVLHQKESPAVRLSLGNKLEKVRNLTGHSVEILSNMLNIDEESYSKLEKGMAPSQEVLRRISLIYNWNYQDLLHLLRSQQAQKFQPSRVGMPFVGQAWETQKLSSLVRKMQKAFLHLTPEEKTKILAQVELVVQGMEKMESLSSEHKEGVK